MSGRATRCVGILREVKNKWERRAALTPAHVQQLVAQGIQVLVQPSDRRVFPDQEYQEAGAVVQEDLASANVILGVKEVPIDKLLPNKYDPPVMFASRSRACVRAPPRGVQSRGLSMQGPISCQQLTRSCFLQRLLKSQDLRVLLPRDQGSALQHAIAGRPAREEHSIGGL